MCWVKEGSSTLYALSFGSDVEESASNAVDPGWIPGSGRCPGRGHGNPLQHSCLENSMDRGALAGYSPWGHRVRQDWVTKTFTFSLNPYKPRRWISLTPLYGGYWPIVVDDELFASELNINFSFKYFSLFITVLASNSCKGLALDCDSKYLVERI